MATWSRTPHNCFYQTAYRIRAAVLVVLSAVFLGGVWVQWVLPPPKAMLPLPVITFDDGHGWFAKLPRFPSSSWQRRLYIIRPDDSVPNGVTLYEDGRPLPFPDSELHDIRDAGEGRHSRLGDAVYFSASDNGDPTSGGRVYEVEIWTRPRARVMALIVLSAAFGVIPAISLSRRLTRFAGVGAAFAASLSRRLARSAASLSCRLAQSLFRGATFAASLSRRLARSAASLSCRLAQSLFRGAAFAASLSRRLTRFAGVGAAFAAWKNHAGKRLPRRLWASMLRPENEDENDLPAQGFFRRGSPVRHTLCLAGAALLALTLWFCRASHTAIDWADAARYLAHGRSLMERGTTMPSTIPYDVFIALRENADDPYAEIKPGKSHYPNISYQFLLGWLGKWRADYSQINGLWVSAFFSVLLAFTLYACGFSMARSHFLSLGLVAGVLANPIVNDVSGRPLTDMAMLFFFMTALYAMSRGRVFLSGAAMGAGYLFREAIITYLPALPLASPKGATWRGYARALVVAACCCAVGMMAQRGLVALYRPAHHAHGSGSFYVDWLSGQIKNISLSNMANHALFYARQANPFGFPWAASGVPDLCAFVAVLAAVCVASNALGRRLVIAGLWILAVPCVAMAMLPYNDARYAAAAIIVFWLAMLLAANRLRFRAALFSVLLATTVFTNLPSHITAQIFGQLRHPRAAWARLEAPWRAKSRLSGLFKPGSVIMTAAASGFGISDEFFFSRPVLVNIIPDYEKWRETKGNERIDAITFLHREGWVKRLGLTWPDDVDVYEDYFGVRFVRFKGFDDEMSSMWPRYEIFVRE